MKKLLIICLSLALLFLLVACGDGTPAIETTAGATTTAATATTTTVPVTEADTSPRLFGVPLSEYTILVDRKNTRDAEKLFSFLYKNYGVILPVEAKTESEHIIRLERSDDLSPDTCYITREGTVLTASGWGINGTYLAAVALCELFGDAYREPVRDLTLERPRYVSVADHLSPLTTELLDAEGGINSYYEGDLNLAFIGGSLTQGKSAWMDPVADLFREWYPDATVNCLDAGIGATNSELGAARLEKTVFSNMIPDILFVDFSVNDGGYTTETDAAIRKCGVYMESIVKQCRALEKPPIIIFLHFPVGQRIDSAYHEGWARGVLQKDRLAEHYGIGTIDVWERFEALYLEALTDEPALSYSDFLLRYYAPSDMTHPVAAGFAVFGDAITAALRADPARYLVNRIEADTYFEKFERISDRTHTFRTLEDTDYFTVEGNFTHHKTAAYTADDPRYLPGRMNAMQLADGVHQCDDKTAFTISFDTMASAIKLYGINAPCGMEIAVYADGEKIGTVSTKANNTYLYFHSVEIPGGGDSLKRIELRPEAVTEDSYVFRIGYLVECFE